MQDSNKTEEELQNGPQCDSEDASPPHSKLYKYNGIFADQTHRRQALLEEIKKRRDNFIDKKRNIDDIIDENNGTDEEVQEVDEELMDVEVKKQKKKRFLRLMLSEWLSELPEDLENSWLIKLSPLGQRRLVIASKCNTCAYNKYGSVKSKFPSMLPGGNSQSVGKTFTVLDCIYNFPTKTYFVLDIIAWNSHSLLKCTAEFRFFFLTSKIDESPELQEETPSNRHKFVNIHFFPAELPLIEERLSQAYEIGGVEVKLDGVLFYYKEMFYRKGICPLVGWLKPYMVPEVLNIPVSEKYLTEKPKHYESFAAHIQKLQQYAKTGKTSEEAVEMDAC